jgi:hypothetical protein
MPLRLCDLATLREIKKRKHPRSIDPADHLPSLKKER